LLQAHDLIDLRDGGEPCVPRGLSVISAELFDEVGHGQVGDHREVSAGMSRVALCRSPPLEKDHGPARREQEISGGKARQAPANYDDVGILVLIEWPEMRQWGRLNPIRTGLELDSH